MAYGKLKEKLFLILSLFASITLIKCRSLLLDLSGTQKTINGGSKVISKQYVSDQKPFVNFGNLGNDAKFKSSDLPTKAIIKGKLISPSEAVWNAMSPKLSCGDDIMKLQLSGPEVAQVELCQGSGSPVSLSYLPPYCGDTIPTYGGLVYSTPYDGCGVTQQGGSYVMKMQWQGNPAVIYCPVGYSEESKTPTTLKPQIGYPQTFLERLWPYYYASKVYPTDVMTALVPTTKPVIAQMPTENPQQLSGFQMLWPYLYPDYNYPGKTLPKPTPATPKETPQIQGYPQELLQFFYPQYQYPGQPKPMPKPVPTSPTTTISDAQAPPMNPQFAGYPPGFWQWYSTQYNFGKPKPIPNSVPTTTPVGQAPPMNPQFQEYPQGFWQWYSTQYNFGKPKPIPYSVPTTTPIVQAPPMNPQFQGYPQEFWQWYFAQNQFGRPKPIPKPVPTSVAQVPPEKPQLSGYPLGLWPYYFPYSNYGMLKPNEKPISIPTTTSSVAQTPIQYPQLPGYPQISWPYYYFLYYNRGGLPVSASIPTTSAESQAPPQNPQIPGYPQMFWPYYLSPYDPQYTMQLPQTPTIEPTITPTSEPCPTTVVSECKSPETTTPDDSPQYRVAQSSMFYNKDPFGRDFVDLTEFDAESFP